MPSKNATLYDTDFYAWANEQAAFLRACRLSEADVENIAAEIESMGRAEKRELIHRLTELLSCLLKWRYQSAFRGRSWQLEIEQQRLRVNDHLTESPSLKSNLNEVVDTSYRYALFEAERETGRPREIFPPDRPFSFDEALSESFWPD